MAVEIRAEIEQLVFEISGRPEQHAVQVFASDGANESFDEWMGQGNVGHRLNFGDLQYPEIGLPLLKPKERIMVGTHVLWHRAAPSNGAIEHPAECNAIDNSGVDGKPNDAPRVLIHHDENPVSSQRRRLATEQVEAPQTVLRVTQKRQP